MKNFTIDEYIERNEQIESERKMKAIEAEYIKSGYWPSDDDCPHHMDKTGKCEWCGFKEVRHDLSAHFIDDNQ